MGGNISEVIKYSHKNEPYIYPFKYRLGEFQMFKSPIFHIKYVIVIKPQSQGQRVEYQTGYSTE